MNNDILTGHSYPLGATVCDEGVNFSVFSKNCTAMELLLFDDADAGPSRILRLDPARHRTFYYWHACVPGLRSGQLYGFRAHGPYNPEKGHRFDGSKVLLDPYGHAVIHGLNYSREAATHPGDNSARSLKSVVLDPRAYDWEGVVPPRRSLADTVIYEMHVAGFTKHPNSGVAPNRRGTYAGLIEKIPYLKDLGVTAVELLPVQQYDEQEMRPGCTDYWGYNPIAFFAPHRGYSSRKEIFGPVNEFRDMVKALHRAGIEVILDMVFNHTGEGDHRGPTNCFRGFENRAYYLLETFNRAYYTNYTGCGNTLNGNHSIVRRMIVECLQYWVRTMHVDGFRFDLASVLARGEAGELLQNPPILWEIESDPTLAGSKIIAEAWDAAGLYQVGRFIGHRWAEWNGHYRDDVRRFVQGNDDTVSRLAPRLIGSPDVFPVADRDPNRSINFVTCHDGFTLADLASYNQKHNEANGEDNRDGMNDNQSWNCGAEGPTDDPDVLALRRRQTKNLMTLLLISHGTPMLLMGDEILRTQHGNNNAYCQDNEISWFDWDSPRRNADMLRFVRRLIAFNRKNPLFRSESFWTSVDGKGVPRITWHGVDLYRPDWGQDSRTLAFELLSSDGSEHLHVILNSYWEALTFELPPLLDGKRWHRVLDTALPSPEDIADAGKESLVPGFEYRAEARSSVLLRAKLMVVRASKAES